MKYTVIVFFFFTAISCTSNHQENITQKVAYTSVHEMLEEIQDYSNQDGSLIVLNDERENYHIQVSNSILESDPDEVIKNQVKMNVIFVAFQAFALTDIEEFKITSIPNSLSDIDKYFPEYEITCTVSKTNAIKILKNEFNSSDFKILFEPNNPLHRPSKAFNDLIFRKREITFQQLIKE